MQKPRQEQDSAASTRQRQPLARGIELLTLIIDSDQETHGVRALAGQLGVSPSTAHRLLVDLEQLGLLSRTQAGTYQLGLEFLRLAWSTVSKHPLHELSPNILQGLNKQTGETSFFGIYNEQRAEMMFTLTVESDHPLRYVIPLREWLPLHAGASGLAILAFAPEHVLRAVIEAPLDAKTDRTLVGKDALMERLQTVQQDGYAITHGERISGAVAIAAPVFGPTGVIGVVGISLPESRFNASQLDTLTGVVLDAANELTRQMTGPASPRTG